MGDVHPRAQPHFNEFVQFKSNDGFANRWSGNIEGLRQLALRGKPLSDLVFSFSNVPRKLLRDLFVEPARFSHAAQYPRTPRRQQPELVRALSAAWGCPTPNVVRGVLALGLTNLIRCRP